MDAYERGACARPLLSEWVWFRETAVVGIDSEAQADHGQKACQQLGLLEGRVVRQNGYLLKDACGTSPQPSQFVGAST
jgi:hypothetical protein